VSAPLETMPRNQGDESESCANELTYSKLEEYEGKSLRFDDVANLSSWIATRVISLEDRDTAFLLYQRIITGMHPVYKYCSGAPAPDTAGQDTLSSSYACVLTHGGG
jgi:hypothetical protein